MTAHVARKGEPEEKHASLSKSPTTTSSPTKHYMQLNSQNYGSNLPKVATPQTPSTAAIEDNNFKPL
jgi:hypothetical protein